MPSTWPPRRDMRRRSMSQPCARGRRRSAIVDFDAGDQHQRRIAGHRRLRPDDLDASTLGLGCSGSRSSKFAIRAGAARRLSAAAGCGASRVPTHPRPAVRARAGNHGSTPKPRQPVRAPISRQPSSNSVGIAAELVDEKPAIRARSLGIEHRMRCRPSAR